LRQDFSYKEKLLLSKTYLDKEQGRWNQGDRRTIAPPDYGTNRRKTESKLSEPLRTFSNFSCMFLNPNNFFQFEL
jgi:hypothetical protein